MTLPTPTVTPGPLYATENNQAFNVLDAHDHSPGNGVPIPSVGININGDLGFNGFNANLLRSTIYNSQSSPLALPTDIRSIYSVGGDLYWNNGIGQPVQITAGAALNAASIGGIGGDYTTSGASVFYTSADLTYTFWSSSNTTGSIEAGPLTIRNNTLNSFGVTINANATISANYSLVLPAALPGSGVKFLTVDASGNIADVYDTDNSTITVTSNLLNVLSSGIVDNVTTQSVSNLIGVKPGSLNQSFFGTLGQQVSTPSGVVFTASTVMLTELSVTITTSGRPVMLMIQGDPATSYSYITSSTANSTFAQRWLRDSIDVVGSYEMFLAGSGNQYPCNVFTCMDYTVTAGTHLYEFQISTLPGQSIGISNLILVAYEL